MLDFSREGLRFTVQTCDSCPGTYMAHATVAAYPCPVSTLYFGFNCGPEVMEIRDIFTNRRYRRKGIAKDLVTYAVNAFIKPPDFVVTGSKSSKNGKALMFSLGGKMGTEGPYKEQIVWDVKNA